jgi:adhesin transport system outer membrane protein
MSRLRAVAWACAAACLTALSQPATAQDAPADSPAEPATTAPPSTPGTASQRLTEAQALVVAPAQEALRSLSSLWEMMNPLAANPGGGAPVRLDALRSRNVAERSTRVTELPGLLSLPDTLPLKETADPALSGAATSLQQSIEAGVANSLEVKAAMARREAGRQGVLVARGALLPQLEARAGAGTGRLGSVYPAEDRHRKEGNITLRQALFDAPAWREVDRQHLLSDATELQMEAATSAAALETATAYLQAVQARTSLALGTEYEKMLGTLLTLVTDRAQGGATSLAERDRVRARVANARSQMADARANLRAAQRNLAILTGSAPEVLVVGVPTLLTVPVAADDARSEAHLFNPDLYSARLEAQAIGQEAHTARGKLLPRLDAELSHSRATNSSGSPGYQRDTKGMLVLNWALLNGGSDIAQQRGALARQKEKQLRADDIERRLDQEIEAAYAALDTVDDRYAALKDELAANRTVVDAFRSQLVSGNRQLLDVLDAYQRLHQSRLDMTALVLGELQNQVKVAHLTGRLARGVAPRP